MDYQLLISIPLIKEEILPKRLKLNKRFEDCFLKDLYFYINYKINKVVDRSCVAQVDTSHWSRMAFDFKPTGRSLGRPRMRWMDGVRNDLAAIGDWENWREKTKDCSLWGQIC